MEKKKFDIIVMNPPYNRGISDKFLCSVCDYSNIIVTIQPSNWLFGSRQNKNIISKIKSVYHNIEQIIFGFYADFDACGGNELAINYIDYNRPQTVILNDTVLNNDITQIKHYSSDNLIVEFDNIIKPLYTENNVKDNILKYENGEIVDDEHWCIKIPKIRGHIRAYGYDPDFYTVISNNNKFINENVIGKFKDIRVVKDTSNLKFYIDLKTYNAARNFINYLQTDFARTALYLRKINITVATSAALTYIPFFDFNDDIFSKTPKEIDDYLFAKYNISDAIRNHIATLLPDYYSIRS